MIRQQPLPNEGAKAILRFFHDDGALPMAPFDAACVVHWSDARSMWIHCLLIKNGVMTRAWLLELLAVAEEGGATWIKAKRADGHRIPGGVVQPNGDVWVDVQAMRGRFPFNTAFAAL